ncbi:MAG: co-chaperone GroES [Bacteroidetes bacterium]|nr:MAG: co-chaperone GroES [Bacteroidota bacterium]
MSTIKIKPLHDYILVEPIETEKVTAGGIIIPDSSKEKPQKGNVVAIGNGIDNKKMNVSTNDIVLYGKYAGTEISDEEKNYLMIKEEDILAILK